MTPCLPISIVESCPAIPNSEMFRFLTSDQFTLACVPGYDLRVKESIPVLQCGAASSMNWMFSALECRGIGHYISP